jgi:hypothetical protein
LQKIIKIKIKVISKVFLKKKKNKKKKEKIKNVRFFFFLKKKKHSEAWGTEAPSSSELS